MANASPASSVQPAFEQPQPISPAEAGVWVFIFADMCIFATYFGVHLYEKALQPAMFAEGQATLATHLGAFNTLVLLTSSWLMARAVHAARSGAIETFSRNLQITMVCGIAFLCVKAIEYSGAFAAGFDVATNAFFRNYFAFTGFHMLHVILGLSFLVWMLFAVKTPTDAKAHIRTVEGVGLYWHMVDLLWVILFALIYLAP